jgi:hypothetical protein
LTHETLRCRCWPRLRARCVAASTAGIPHTVRGATRGHAGSCSSRPVETDLHPQRPRRQGHQGEQGDRHKGEHRPGHRGGSSADHARRMERGSAGLQPGSHRAHRPPQGRHRLQHRMASCHRSSRPRRRRSPERDNRGHGEPNATAAGHGPSTYPTLFRARHRYARWPRASMDDSWHNTAEERRLDLLAAHPA